MISELMLTFNVSDWNAFTKNISIQDISHCNTLKEDILLMREDITKDMYTSTNSKYRFNRIEGYIPKIMYPYISLNPSYTFDEKIEIFKGDRYLNDFVIKHGSLQDILKYYDKRVYNPFDSRFDITLDFIHDLDCKIHHTIHPRHIDYDNIIMHLHRLYDVLIDYISYTYTISFCNTINKNDNLLCNTINKNSLYDVEVERIFPSMKIIGKRKKNALSAPDSIKQAVKNNYFVKYLGLSKFMLHNKLKLEDVIMVHNIYSYINTFLEYEDTWYLSKIPSIFTKEQILNIGIQEFDIYKLSFHPQINELIPYMNNEQIQKLSLINVSDNSLQYIHIDTFNSITLAENTTLSLDIHPDLRVMHNVIKHKNIQDVILNLKHLTYPKMIVHNPNFSLRMLDMIDLKRFDHLIRDIIPMSIQRDSYTDIDIIVKDER